MTGLLYFFPTFNSRKKDQLGDDIYLIATFLEQLSKRQYAGITSLLEKYLHQQMCKVYLSLVRIIIIIFFFFFFYYHRSLSYLFLIFIYLHISTKYVWEDAYERRYYAVSRKRPSIKQNVCVCAYYPCRL